MTRLKIVSIGAAVQDVFLSGKVLKATHESNGDWVEELPLGAKLDLDNIVFSTGGGATNGSVTFARQGLTSAFMGQIGYDPAGQAVIADLKQDHVQTDLVIYSKDYSTGYSALLLAPRGERTILTYRGASTHYNPKKFKFHKAHADWFFITSLSGNMELLEMAVDYAANRHIKVALIPGKGELKHAGKLKKLLPKVTILSANKEETQLLFDGETSEELVRNGIQRVPYLVVTDGPRGVVAGDRANNKMVTGGMYEDVPVIDRTGAGDAFASGFTAKIAMGESLENAVVFASANSTSVVGQIGAKGGILHKDIKLHAMDLKVESF